MNSLKHRGVGLEYVGRSQVKSAVSSKQSPQTLHHLSRRLQLPPPLFARHHDDVTTCSLVHHADSCNLCAAQRVQNQGA